MPSWPTLAGGIARRALLDSGAHFTRLSLPIVQMMERTFPGVQMRVPFLLGARQAVTASGQKVSVTDRTIPLQLALVTPWGPAPLLPIWFAIMPPGGRMAFIFWGCYWCNRV